MTEEFNLRQLIHQVVSDLDTIDVQVIINETNKRITDAMLRTALDQLLHYAVKDVLTQYRPRGSVAVPQPTFKAPATDRPGHARLVTGGSSPPALLSGTRKGDEIRDAWQRTLESPYNTPHGQRRLGDCTYSDLIFIASSLDKQAEEFKARARGFREIAHLLTDHESGTVRELPAGVLMNALGGK